MYKLDIIFAAGLFTMYVMGYVTRAIICHRAHLTDEASIKWALG